MNEQPVEALGGVGHLPTGLVGGSVQRPISGLAYVLAMTEDLRPTVHGQDVRPLARIRTQPEWLAFDGAGVARKSSHCFAQT